MTEPSPVALWLGLALAIFGLVYGLRRTPYVRNVWDAIPTELKPFAPVALGVTMAGFEAVASGRSLRQALAIAASAALTAMLGHHALRASPLPYGDPPTLELGDENTATIPPAVILPPEPPPPRVPPPPPPPTQAA